MAPASLTVKSESWLDLAQIGLLASAPQQQRRQAPFRRLAKQSSVPPESNARRLSTSSLVAAQGNNTEDRSCASSTFDGFDQRRESNGTSGASNNKNEHLLIRLRQRSYLNRSSSTTLSSNLSHSIELPRAPSSQSLEPVEGGAHEQVSSNAPRRDLSFGLRSFRARFERRFQRARGASSGAASPLARSWSSLSEQVSSRLNHLGHSWKSFLYNYQQQRQQRAGCREPAAGLELGGEEADELRWSRRLAPEAPDELQRVRRRLTADWIRRHSQPLANAAPQLDHRQLADELRQRRQIPASPPLQDIRPRSFQWPQSSEKQLEVELSQRPWPASFQAAEQQQRRRPPRLARSQSQQPQGSQQAVGSIQTAPAITPQRRLTQSSSSSATTNTSATLVNDSRASPGKLGAELLLGQQQQQKQQQQQQQQQAAESSNKLTLASERLLGAPQVATSDYWSSSALTTATSVASRQAAKMQPRRRQPPPLLQQQQQRQAYNSTTPDAERLEGHLNDQDYYLDVAAAAQFDQFSGLNNNISNNNHNRRSLQASSRQLPADLVAMLQPGEAGANFAFAGQHQRQLDELALADERQLRARLSQAQEDWRLSELTGAATAAAPPDDYDDYAVPSDESCCRLERSQVELVQLIGEGQKGYVFLGKLQARSGASMMDVAIKTLKFETEQLIERLMSEAAMMKQLEHPHIIKFIGMCPETPALIAMELARFGEIKHFLKLHQSAIKISQLVLFAFQISTALSYLESKNYVHRDVAARNVLVCSPQCVKLADFGLSRHLSPSSGGGGGNLRSRELADAARFGQQVNFNYPPLSATANAGVDCDEGQLYVAAPRVKLPVRWLAPESLVFRRFTSASDVWMFAVCTWELFHFGQARPWPQLRNNQVLLAIEAGQRLAQPEACPQRLYQLMLKCWSYAPVQRPKFREIKQSIWSIYLNERTREQLELEQFERAKQRYLISQQQQQLAALSATGRLLAMPANQAANQTAGQQPSYSTYSSTNTTTDRSTSPASSAGNPNSLARRQRAQRQERAETVRLAAPEVARANQLGQQQQQQAAASALQAQWERFQRRQSPASGGGGGGGAWTAAGSPESRRQPHALQKQRSQGAIGLRSSPAEEPREACDKQTVTRPGADSRRQQQQQQQRGSLRRHRRPTDDSAPEFQRGELAQRARQRLYAAALKDIDCDEDDEDEDEESAKGRVRGDQERAGRAGQMAPEVRREHERLLNCALVIRDFSPAPQVPRLPASVSPALTASEEPAGSRLSGPNSRLTSLEPAYEGLAASRPRIQPPPPQQQQQRRSPHAQQQQQQQQQLQHPKLSSGNQVAMLRAKYDVSNQALGGRSSPARQLTSSPALTAATQTPASRPTSWRSDASQQQQQPEVLLAPLSTRGLFERAPAAQSEVAQMRVARPPDQLGQMLQALRITPMKARLKSPPEQTVRVLQRHPDEPAAAPLAAAPAPKPAPNLFQAAREEPPAAGNRLLLHQRLLGRIRPHPSDVAQCERHAPKQRREEGGAGGVETTVEQSLQLLESLMQPGEQQQQQQRQLVSAGSLPRARPKHAGRAGQAK